jgi:hypothetical protein
MTAARNKDVVIVTIPEKKRPGSEAQQERTAAWRATANSPGSFAAPA